MRVTADYFDGVRQQLLGKIGAGTSFEGIVGDVVLCLRTREITGPLGTQTFSKTEYQIFWLLARIPNTVITRDELIEFLYEDDEKDLPMSNTIEVFVQRIRKQLRLISKQVTIETFRGFGYQCLV